MILYYVIGFFCLLFAGAFIGFGIYIRQSDTPMHFWSQTILRADEITDVSAFNRANAAMWFCHSILFFCAGIFALLQKITISAILVGINFFPGFLVLTFIYWRIEKKYRSSHTIKK